VTKTVSMLTLAFAIATAAAASAQDQTAPAAVAAKTSAAQTVPLRVQIVMSRFQGEKKVSSLPYTLSVNATVAGMNRASLRMGTQVPVVLLAMANPPKDAPQSGPVQYKDVGTNIDCDPQVLDDGRFRIQVIVDDASVYPDDHPKEADAIGRPSFRQFRATNSTVLKDGGTAQFSSAVDKVNGETLRIDITLTVVR